MFVYYNPNPAEKEVGDCVIRAIAKALNKGWEEAYIELCLKGYEMRDMPNSNAVWGAYLKEKGFKRCAVSESCSECYTIEDFTKEFPKGTYVIGTGTHAVTLIDGKIYDSYDTSSKWPLYYYKKEEA